MSVHYSSHSHEWSTPDDFYRELDREFHSTLDPCATKENAKCRRFFTKYKNGLIQDWSDHVVFMNPPYGHQIKYWMRKAYQESLRKATVVCLVPARTDTKWWHEYAMRGEVRFVKGRLKFGNSKNNSPFPSAVVVFRKIKADIN